MPANEFLRVSMLFPNCLDVSVLVFDNFLNLSTLGSGPDAHFIPLLARSIIDVRIPV